MKARPSHRITGVRLLIEVDGRASIGDVIQIEPDAILSVCGPGLNDMTVRVRMEDAEYLVFAQDIRPLDE
jgi:hypothetical protein